MVYNEVLNLIQRKTKESQILKEISSYQQNINYEDGANTEYENKYLALKSAIDDLPTRQKLVFILSKEKGLKQEEIAHELIWSREGGGRERSVLAVPSAGRCSKKRPSFSQGRDVEAFGRPER